MKNWIRRWLGLLPAEPGILASMRSPNRSILDNAQHRNFFEIIPAVNGKIVVFTRHQFNHNGPDKNDMEVYLVHDGENLMDVVTTAIVSAGLK